MAHTDIFPVPAAKSRVIGLLSGLADLLFRNAKIQASVDEAHTAARQSLPSSLDLHTALYIRSLSR